MGRNSQIEPRENYEVLENENSERDGSRSRIHDQEIHLRQKTRPGMPGFAEPRCLMQIAGPGEHKAPEQKSPSQWRQARREARSRPSGTRATPAIHCSYPFRITASRGEAARRSLHN